MKTPDINNFLNPDIFSRVFDSVNEASFKAYKTLRDQDVSPEELSYVDNNKAMEARYQEEKSCHQN